MAPVKLRYGLSDLPPVALSLGSTAWNETGAWRSREPVFGDRRPPCAAACPSGQDVVDQLRLYAQGRAEDAGVLLLGANPFPSTTGRVCPHPCTAACNRAAMEGAVDIPGIERALGDALIESGYRPPSAPPDGVKVAVVGAGPAGMTAASYLAAAGARVTLFDRAPRPGGLLVSGIPPYRLPRALVEAEIARALSGVQFHGGRTLGGDLALPNLRRVHDAVVLAVGRHAPRPLHLKEGGDRVVSGLALLDAVHRGEPAPDGERVLVVGGGNTALDCSRTLGRLGRRVTVVYRRDRASMPAFTDEIEEALEEGIRIEEWALPVSVQARGGRTTGLRCVRARPGAPDASGRRRPEPVPGSDYTLPADLVVSAAGETLDRDAVPSNLLVGEAVGVDDGLRVGPEHVWACGDCVGGGGTVAEAIGQGRRVAAAVAQAYGLPPPTVDRIALRGAAPQVAGADTVRPQYFPPSRPRTRGRAPIRDGEREVRLGFSPGEARLEAARCMSCGTCTGCDNCYQLCPDQAVLRAEPGGYRVDARRCKGCGICVEECPRGAVHLVERGEH